MYQFSSVQFSHSVVSNSLRHHDSQHTRPPCPSLTPRVHSNSCPSSQWCHPSISSSVVPFLLLPPIPPSIRVFSNESTLRMRWPKYWSFSFSISPSNEHPELISFRMDWLDLLAVQGTLKSLLQHHSSKASILRCSAFFTVQPSHPYMTTGKTIALTRWTFVTQPYCWPFTQSRWAPLSTPDYWEAGQPGLHPQCCPQKVLWWRQLPLPSHPMRWPLAKCGCGWCDSGTEFIIM